MLRRDLSDSTAHYNDLRVTMQCLETEVDALQVRHDRDTGVNENRRINQLKVGIQDSERRSKRMEKEFDNIVQRW